MGVLKNDPLWGIKTRCKVTIFFSNIQTFSLKSAKKITIFTIYAKISLRSLSKTDFFT